jgi:hypothetical protein
MLRKTLYGLAGLAVLSTAALTVPTAIATPSGEPNCPVALDQHERHPDFRWSDLARPGSRAALDLHERHTGFRWSDLIQPGEPTTPDA